MKSRSRTVLNSIIISLSVHITAMSDVNAQAGQIRTHTVDVRGHAVRVQHSGLEGRSSGEPVIVLEAGATNSIEVWSQVLPKIAEFAPVIAYDRAGLGESEWDGQEPTPQHVADRLKVTLSALEAGPPYVLVGFSWGGALVRYFAGLNPDAVAGLVYVDPGPIITQTLAEDLAPYVESGAGVAGKRAFWQAFEAFSSRASPAISAEFQVFSGLMQREVGDRNLPPSPKVPVAVIVAGKYQPYGLQLPYDPEKHFEADVRHRIRMLAEWALEAPHGTLLFSNNSSHVVPIDEPDLVVWAVRRVLTAQYTR
jgi:pimeloyl-ACP methyl ester carboxylesterase